MSAIDYTAISEGIRTVIQTHVAGEPNLVVEIESEVAFSPENPLVQIYLVDRVAIPGEQRISAGRRTHYQINFSIWCFGFSLDGGLEACRARDQLLSKVEIALMKDRTLNGTVQAAWIEGGEFTGTEREGGFFRAGEIRLGANAHTSY